MATERKITVHVDSKLLGKAQRQTGEGLSATVRQGLKLVAASAAYDGLLALRGKVDVAFDSDALRADRS